MKNREPIGVFDSGVGGLSVWNEIRKRLPKESLVYYGDGKNCPYGEKSAEQVVEYTLQAVEWLINRGVKMVVVACNTATITAIKSVRERYTQVPIVGLEPAVKPAALSSRSGRIGVLATRRSIEGEMFKSLYERFEGVVEIISVVGEGFVEIVESGTEDSDRVMEAVRGVVEPLLERGVDKIVLGCTHYSFLERQIKEVVEGKGVEVVDSKEAVAEHVENLLTREGRLYGGEEAAEYEFYTLGGDDYLRRIENIAERCVSAKELKY